MKMKENIFKLLILTLILVLSLSYTISAQNMDTIAVVDFTNNTGYRIPKIGNTASEYISTLLSNKNGIQVVEREKLKSIRREQKFTQSGIVDNKNTAIQLGKLLGAEYIVTGSLMNLNINETQFEGYDIETTKVEVSLSTNIKLLNVSTGVIEQGNIYNASKTYQGESEYSLDGNGAVRDLVERISRQFVNEVDFSQEEKKKELKKHEVNFSSTPKGASIEIDGIYMGSTPAAIPVEEGIHRVKISMGGYITWDKKVNVYEGLEVNAVLGEKESSDEE